MIIPSIFAGLFSSMNSHQRYCVMSKKIIAKTKNEKIKNLADSIIKSQLQEIQLMNDILQDT